MSLHADALRVLTAWSAPTPEQEALRVRYVDHLRGSADGMLRASFPEHLTSGVLVVDQSLERVLLNLHGKARRWFAFGGHCEDADPTLADAARREGREESGIDDLRFDPVPAHLDAHAVPFCDPRGTVHHLDVRYVAQAPAGAEPAPSEESLEVRWWPIDDLPELEPEMHELIGIARDRFTRSRLS